ncbi:Hypothetical predicted protein [Pelobates cultripes]|uniref:Uncharacterized protein n=1 Tax=Pelobates cultripes TaxID=61616 RepID=A0AAD1S816_PELCU|nr:Hypothetical predicted protein [Pelobates cultripes]
MEESTHLSRREIHPNWEKLYSCLTTPASPDEILPDRTLPHTDFQLTQQVGITAPTMDFERCNSTCRDSTGDKKPNRYETPKATWTAMYHVLISAATLIARYWKQVAIPSRELLIQQVSLNWVYETVFATQFGTKKHLKQAHTTWTDFLTRSVTQAAPKENPPTTTQDKTPRKPHTDQTPA